MNLFDWSAKRLFLARSSDGMIENDDFTYGRRIAYGRPLGSKGRVRMRTQVVRMRAEVVRMSRREWLGGPEVRAGVAI